MRVARPILLSIAALAMLGPWAAQAQTARSGGNSASAQIMQEYQRLAAERTELTAENAKLKKDLEDAKARLSAAEKAQASMKARIGEAEAASARASAANQTTEQALAKSKENLQKLLAKAREIAAQLGTVESERNTLQEQLTQVNHKYDKCVDDNMRLFAVNDEILNRYEHQSAFARAATIDSFTRLKRTQNENLVDEYRERAEELRLQKEHSAPPGASPPPAPVAAPAAETTQEPHTP
jgi:chromosome segregation ATPase